MVLHYASYSAHLADLSAATRDNLTDGPRDALSRMDADAVAQVMSFMGAADLKRKALTLSATCPQMSLDVMALRTADGNTAPELQIQTFDRKLYCSLDAASVVDRRSTLHQTLWWAELWKLPLRLAVDNEQGELLASLTDSLRKRVAALHIRVLTSTLCGQGGTDDASGAAQCDGRCGTCFCALFRFPSLSSLSIECRRMGVSDSAAAAHDAVRVAAELSLTELGLHNIRQMRDFSALPEMHHLESLVVNNCDIQSLTGLERFPMLASLNVSRNGSLWALDGLAAAPYIRRIIALDCDLQDLNDLHQFKELKEVNVSYNLSLRSINGLAGAPRLERIDASSCLLEDVGDLHRCALLKNVNVSFNSRLRSLSGLAGAPRLEKIVARHCGLRDVGDLYRCLTLREVDVLSNRFLRSLRGLAGAPSLEIILGKGCYS